MNRSGSHQNNENGHGAGKAKSMPDEKVTPFA